MYDLKFISEVVEHCSKNKIKEFNSITGEVYKSGNSFEDLGDYLPVYFFLNRNDLVEQELEKVIEHLTLSDYLFKESGSGVHKFLNRCYSQTDLLWGLYLASLKDSKYTSVFVNTLNVVAATFLTDRPKMFLLDARSVSSILHPTRYLSLKVLSSEDHGMYIEIFCKAYELTGDSSYIDQAKTLLNKLMETETYSNHGFFPFFESQGLIANLVTRVVKGFSKRKGEFQLLKQNSNTMFGIYALGKHSDECSALFKEIILRFIDKYFDSNLSIFYTNYSVERGPIGSDLTVFHIIELLLLADEIDMAMTIADGVISTQSTTTGLIPFFNPNFKPKLKRINLTLNSSWLDSEVDFGVALMRLYAHSHKSRYIEAARKIQQGIEKFHRHEHGYCAEVNVESGQVINPKYSSKMNGLVAKLSYAIENPDVVIDENNFYYEVLQDR